MASELTKIRVLELGDEVERQVFGANIQALLERQRRLAVIVDAHTHLFDRFEYLVGLTAEQMVANLDRAGIDVAVLFTVRGLLGAYRETNEEIAATAARFPDRFVPFASVNPRDGEAALAEMERAVGELGCRGFKLHPWWTSFPANSPAALAVARKGDELGVPFLIHSGTPPTSTPLQIAEMARVAPRATFILGHMGLPDLWKEALQPRRGTRTCCSRRAARLAGDPGGGRAARARARGVRLGHAVRRRRERALPAAEDP